MRVQLKSDFTSKSFDFLMADGKSINTMILLPYLQDEDDETERMKLTRLAALERKFESGGDEFLSNRSHKESFNTLEDINPEEHYDLECKKLVMINQPNAALYEV